MATQYTAGIVTGQKWTAAIANQIGAAWETYTPTFTNITVGNGSFTARYGRIQNLVFVDVSFTLGSTSSVSGSGACAISLPVTAYAATGNPILGTAQYYDSGSLRYFGFVLYNNSTTFAAGYDTSNRYQEIYSLGPFTWGAGDQMAFHFFYEAA